MAWRSWGWLMLSANAALGLIGGVLAAHEWLAGNGLDRALAASSILNLMVAAVLWEQRHWWNRSR